MIGKYWTVYWETETNEIKEHKKKFEDEEQAKKFYFDKRESVDISSNPVTKASLYESLENIDKQLYFYRG